MSGGTSDGTPAGGLRGALAEIGAAIFDLVGTRLELAVLELNEQRERAKSALLLLLIAAIFFSFAILTLSAVIVVAFWDTHRIAALVGVAIAHLVIGIAALWRLKTHERSFGAPFDQTRAEFERDRQWLARERRANVTEGGAAR